MHAVWRKAAIVTLLSSAAATGQVAAVQAAEAQTEALSDQEAQPETARQREVLPEEITVTGQKLFIVLKQQIEEAEDLMYGLFNDMNEDDRYDIHCTWEAPLGTRIRQRVCRPEFVANADEAVAKDFLAQSQGLTTTNSPPVQAEMGFHYPILEEKLREALVESPEFAEAVVRHHELREEFQRRTSTYFGQDEAED